MSICCLVEYFVSNLQYDIVSGEVSYCCLVQCIVNNVFTV